MHIIVCIYSIWLFHHCIQSNNRITNEKNQIFSSFLISYRLQSATAYCIHTKTVSFLLCQTNCTFFFPPDPFYRVVKLWLLHFDILWMLEWLNYGRRSGFPFSKKKNDFFSILFCFCNKRRIVVYVCQRATCSVFFFLKPKPLYAFKKGEAYTLHVCSLFTYKVAHSK